MMQDYELLAIVMVIIFGTLALGTVGVRLMDYFTSVPKE